MRKYHVKPIDTPVELDFSELFFSTTDRKGVISSCNDVFVRVSKYDSSELLGSAHNRIRHPDMPQCVFKLLWDTILDGRPMGAYVKNMANTGEHYWVFALVMTTDDGFVSVRLKPSSTTFAQVQSLYAELLATEHSLRPDWRQGMAQAGLALTREIERLGFESYEQFMASALHDELLSRSRQLNDRPNGRLENSIRLKTLGQVSDLQQFRGQLVDQKTYLDQLGKNVRMAAINASIVASRHSEDGRALAVISDQISEAADEILSQSMKLSKETAVLREVLQQASTMASSSILYLEMLSSFELQGQASTLSPKQQVEKYGDTLENLGGTLERAYSTAAGACREKLVSLRRSLRAFRSVTEALSKVLLSLQISYVTGMTLTTGIPGAGEFSLLLENVVQLSTAARAELQSLADTIKSASDSADRLGTAFKPVHNRGSLRKAS